MTGPHPSFGDALPTPDVRPWGLPPVVLGLLTLGTAIPFLLARSVVWGQAVSLEDVHLLLAGAFPVAASCLAARIAAPGSAAVGRLAALVSCAWGVSLAIYLGFHVLRRFEPLEAPVRAWFDPGGVRYVAYGAIYSAIAYALVAAIDRLDRGRRPPWFAAALLAGFALNALYFGTTLFMIPIG